MPGIGGVNSNLGSTVGLGAGNDNKERKIMGVGISELVAKIGDDNITLQSLDVCASKLDYSRKSGTKITFHTDMPLTPKGTEMLGLVLWLPRDKAAEILATNVELTGAGTASG